MGRSGSRSLGCQIGTRRAFSTKTATRTRHDRNNVAHAVSLDSVPRVQGRAVRHPEFLLVPVLMISDYLLTIAGARLRADVYGRHFRTQHYELNPAWQSAVAKLRWFNPRHLLITFAFTVFL